MSWTAGIMERLEGPGRPSPGAPGAWTSRSRRWWRQEQDEREEDEPEVVQEAPEEPFGPLEIEDPVEDAPDRVEQRGRGPDQHQEAEHSQGVPVGDDVRDHAQNGALDCCGKGLRGENRVEEIVELLDAQRRRSSERCRRAKARRSISGISVRMPLKARPEARKRTSSSPTRRAIVIGIVTRPPPRGERTLRRILTRRSTVMASSVSEAGGGRISA